jgi:iron complex transport system ATP-binding protein
VDEPEGDLVTTPVRLHAVTVSYDGVPALAGVSVDVAPGEWLGVIGPNGAGKSTLLRAVAGLVPHTGEILVGDRPAGRHRRHLARAVAYVAQDPLVPAGMSVFEYALLGRTAHLRYLAVEGPRDITIVEDVLGQLDLTALADRPLSSLSGGEQQRAVLARALAQQAPVLLLDEPTSALDVGNQQQALELVEDLRREWGLVVVSAMHDLTLAGQFADRLLLLSRGSAVACGPARTVLTERSLSEHWGARVRVLDDPEGGIVVIPIRSGPRGSGRARSAGTRVEGERS